VTYPLGKEIPTDDRFPGKTVTGRSFPSGHAANNLAVATALLLFYPRRGWIYLPIALLIAYSRIYTGAHWPLDVVTGMALGVAGGWIAVRLVESFWKIFGRRLFPKLADLHPEIINEV
jgi:undecaprenyl-diphosphatase